MITVYTTSPDLTLLNTVYNGVAMICQQTAFIWGFALMASFYHLLAGTTKGGVDAATGNASKTLSSASMNAILPFIVAMVITSPNFQSQITIESTYNGNVSTVDHIPLAFSLVPAGVTLLGYKGGVLVETAFQGTGTDYPSISATGNGFINPLKILLSSRDTIMRLNGIAPDVNNLVETCIDSSFDYSKVRSMVNNAGNTGAAAAQSIDIPSLGNPTGIGALLYQASLNTTGMVINLTPTGTVNANTVYNCTDAANIVANNIDTAINSAEFARVIQGAVNFSDAPIAGVNTTLPQFLTSFAAISNSASSATVAAKTLAQTNAEAANFLFDQLVQDSLNCIKASAGNKSTCMASMLQANELERNNLQSAANENQMLKYAGQFSNQMLALLIALGPILVMVMMFVGSGMDKGFKALAQAMFWPTLVINIGAEIINGMTYIQVSNFFYSISHGGFLSPAVTSEAYKELSLQIGTASQLMSGLPLLVSTLFLLSATQKFTPFFQSMQKDNNTVDQLQPQIINSAPLIKSESATQMQRLEGGGAVVDSAGALRMVGVNAQTASLARTLGSNISASSAIENTISSGQREVNAISDAVSNNNYKSLGWSDQFAKAFHDNLSNITSGTKGNDSGRSVHDGQNTQTQTQLGVDASVGVGQGKNSIGLNGSTAASAANTSGTENMVKQNTSLTDQTNIMKALDKTLSDTKTLSGGQETRHNAENSLQKIKDYQEAQSQKEALQRTTSVDSKESSSFVLGSQDIKTATFGHQMNTNKDFMQYQITEGRKFTDNQAAKQYIDKVSANSANYDSLTDPKAQQAAIRHQAALQLEQDTNANPQDRQAALRYLVGEYNSLTNSAYQQGDTSMLGLNLKGPKDDTGAENLKYGTVAPVRVDYANPAVNLDAKANTVKNNIFEVKSTLNREIDDEANKTQKSDSTAVRTAKEAAKNTKETINSAGEAIKPYVNKLPSKNPNNEDETGAGTNG